MSGSYPEYGKCGGGLQRGLRGKLWGSGWAMAELGWFSDCQLLGRLCGRGFGWARFRQRGGTTSLQSVNKKGKLHDMTIRQRPRRHPILLGLALALGFAVQFVDTVLFSHALGKPITISEPAVWVVKALLTAMPLIALAFQARQHIVPWITGFVFSAGLTWWWLKKGIAYQRSPDGSGVDIGGAVVMLLAPFAITGVCLLLNRKLTREHAVS